jgi:hypothetical protein
VLLDDTLPQPEAPTTPTRAKLATIKPADSQPRALKENPAMDLATTSFPAPSAMPSEGSINHAFPL